MNKALIEGIIKYADKDIKAHVNPICICCNSEIIACHGTMKVPYWRHASTSNCRYHSYSKNKMSPWHRCWQMYFDESWREFVYTDREHIADVKTPNGLVIEFQRSNITQETILERETFYGNMIWVVGVKNIVNKNDLGWFGTFSCCKKPVFVDRGDYLLYNHKSGLSAIRKDDFINAIRNDSLPNNADELTDKIKNDICEFDANELLAERLAKLDWLYKRIDNACKEKENECRKKGEIVQELKLKLSVISDEANKLQTTLNQANIQKINELNDIENRILDERSKYNIMIKDKENKLKQLIEEHNQMRVNKENQFSKIIEDNNQRNKQIIEEHNQKIEDINRKINDINKKANDIIIQSEAKLITSNQLLVSAKNKMLSAQQQEQLNKELIYRELEKQRGF